MKYNELMDKLNDANTNQQVSYLLFKAFGSEVSYLMYQQLAKDIHGTYRQYKLRRANGQLLNLNATKQLVRQLLTHNSAWLYYEAQAELKNA